MQYKFEKYRSTGHFLNTGIYRTGQKIQEIQDMLGKLGFIYNQNSLQPNEFTDSN